MSADTKLVRPTRRHGLNDPTGRYPTVERTQYKPLHRKPGETTGDVLRHLPPNPVGEGSRMIRLPVPPPPRTPGEDTAVINRPYETRVMVPPVRASAPIPAPQAPKSAWRILGDALQALRARVR